METIAAIATGQQMSAISIIRLSGDDAFSIVNQIFSKNIMDQPSHTIHYGYIRDPYTNQTIDEVLVNLYRAPKTFTREDVVEINCHGGIYVTNQILTLVLSMGARLAQPGEFTKRAFLNGRLDLTQAEAIEDLLEARDDDQLNLAMNGLRGSVKKLMEPFEDSLVQIISNIEVNIDYPEYDDVEVLTNEKLIPMTKQWLKDIDKILLQAQTGQIVKEGVQVAIVGKPNVGKSSLLNALLEENKAIVTDIEGTTRDIVEGDVRLANITLHLLDTAGIRETDDPVEQIGILKSKQAIEKSQLVLLLLDASKELDEQDKELLELTKDMNRIIVFNKSDKGCVHEGLVISAMNNEIDALIDEINARYEEHHEAVKNPMLANQRQIGLMKQARRAMAQAQQLLVDGVELDLVTMDLQECYRCIKEVMGGYSKEGLLDEIFSRFCLGK